VKIIEVQCALTSAYNSMSHTYSFLSPDSHTSRSSIPELDDLVYYFFKIHPINIHAFMPLSPNISSVQDFRDNFYEFPSPKHAVCPSHFIHLDFNGVMMCSEEQKSWIHLLLITGLHRSSSIWRNRILIQLIAIARETTHSEWRKVTFQVSTFKSDYLHRE
jgi:hypothetical protein